MIERFTHKGDLLLLLGFILAVALGPVIMEPFGARPILIDQY